MSFSCCTTGCWLIHHPVIAKAMSGCRNFLFLDNIIFFTFSSFQSRFCTGRLCNNGFYPVILCRIYIYNTSEISTHPPMTKLKIYYFSFFCRPGIVNVMYFISCLLYTSCQPKMGIVHVFNINLFLRGIGVHFQLFYLWKFLQCNCFPGVLFLPIT